MAQKTLIAAATIKKIRSFTLTLGLTLTVGLSFPMVISRAAATQLLALTESNRRAFRSDCSPLGAMTHNCRAPFPASNVAIRDEAGGAYFLQTSQARKLAVCQSLNFQEVCDEKTNSLTLLSSSN